MGRKVHTPEEIISKLWQGEVLQGLGTPLKGAIRAINVSEVTYCRCRREYGGLQVEQRCRP